MKDRVTIVQSDALAFLRGLEAGSVQCCVTSPPYYGLRDYGTGEWFGGLPDCDHTYQHGVQGKTGQRATRTFTAQAVYKDQCRKCGAVRIDRQIGLEPTPEAFVGKLVDVFREVRRVLADDGVIFVNMGDTYAASGMGGNPEESAFRKQATNAGSLIPGRKAPNGMKPKDLIGVPWMLAFALRADGWYLRSDIIWAKPNPMPESVTDRPTKAHEYLFLLSKSPTYYYDADAIAERAKELPGEAQLTGQHKQTALGQNTTGTLGRNYGQPRKRSGGACFGKQNQDTNGTGAQSRTYERPVYLTRNRRSVWTVTPEPYPGAHFAVMPRKLVEPCILAGSRPGDTVLDPFAGSGTTLAVAAEFGRRGIGCDLNGEYVKLAEERLSRVVPDLFARVT